MNTSAQVACLQPLDCAEMMEVNGGELVVASIWEALFVNLIVNIDSVIRGFIDGWNAYSP